MSAMGGKMEIEQTPIQRTLGLVRMLADNRDFDLGKVKRGWDHAFVESELAWFRAYWDSNEDSKHSAIEAAERLILGRYRMVTQGADAELCAKDRYYVAVAYLRLVGAVQIAIEHANGREAEWGERAEKCFEILEDGLSGEPNVYPYRASEKA